MSTPATVDDAMSALSAYHAARSRRFDELLQASGEPRTSILLEELVRLEEESARIISEEQQNLGRRDQTRLLPGTAALNFETHSSQCHCDSSPTFDETVACALAENKSVDALISRVQSATAAQSIRDLADRLRELEEIKTRQIAKYLRED